MAVALAVSAEPTSCLSPPPPPPPQQSPSTRRSLSLLLTRSRNLSFDQVKQIQAQLFRASLHHDDVLVTKLVSACASSGATSYAARLFSSLPSPDLFLCNCMLRAYALNSLHDRAISFYAREILSRRGFSPDRFTFPYVLKACAALGDVRLGRQLHASLVKGRDTCRDVVALNSLVDMYFKCRQSDSARKVFEAIKEPNSTSWNMMLLGLLYAGDLDAARELFHKMPQRDVVSWNTLMSAYAKAGMMDVAQKLFDEMSERDVVSWNALIAGYAQSRQNDEALSAFWKMITAGFEPDNATLLSVAAACSGACSLTNDMIDQIISFLKSVNSVFVSTALLSLYGKVGKVEEARQIFDQISEKDLVAWNAMIAAYSQNERPVEAIGLFRLLQKCDSGIKPDNATLLNVIDSCSQIGMSSFGDWAHTYIRKNGIETDVFLTTALIDMYAKCGDLNWSRRLFVGMPEKDLASWNAMIKALAIHGQAEEALEMFSLMEKDGIFPNDITFIGLLTACSHGGLLAEGLKLFELMQKKYNFVPSIQHYGCVVDMLGRAGKLAEALELIEGMPDEPDSVIWGALLGACRWHHNVELAEVAARRLAQIDPNIDSNYVLLSNVYASKGKWENVRRTRAKMRKHCIQKTPGCSAVELNGTIHEFIAGDRSHPLSEEIYKAWDKLVKRLKMHGYEPDTGMLVKNVDEEEREESLYRHSEKLALSFALLGSEAKSAVKIIKNLRICSDCHRIMELVSELEKRDIIVRDRMRFHHFRAGQCSCGGYW